MVFRVPLPCSLLPGATPVPPPSSSDQHDVQNRNARGPGALLKALFGGEKKSGASSSSGGSSSRGSGDGRNSGQDTLASSEGDSSSPARSDRRWPWQRRDLR